MWIDYEDETLIINTEKGRQKALNIRNNKNISLVIFKPESMYISWEIRGIVEEVIDGNSANQQIDKVHFTNDLRVGNHKVDTFVV